MKHDDEVIVGDLTRDDFKTAAAALRGKAQGIRTQAQERKDRRRAPNPDQTAAVDRLFDKARKLDEAAAKFERAAS